MEIGHCIARFHLTQIEFCARLINHLTKIMSGMNDGTIFTVHSALVGKFLKDAPQEDPALFDNPAPPPPPSRFFCLKTQTWLIVIGREPPPQRSPSNTITSMV